MFYTIMNIRQQKYKKNRIAGMNMYNAARAAGYSHAMGVKATSVLEPKIPALADWLERQGLTDKKLADFLIKTLDAENVTYSSSGVEIGRKPDMFARLKAAELILKIKGQLKDKVEHSGIGSTQVNVYPNRTYIFCDENGGIIRTGESVHVPESAPGSRTEGKV